MWTSCINQIKQINDRLDNECKQHVENKMNEMVRNYGFMNKQLLKEIKQNVNGTDFESFFEVNDALIRKMGQKYIESIGEIMDYKMKRSEDLYQRMHKIAKKNKLCDDIGIKQENVSMEQQNDHIKIKEEYESDPDKPTVSDTAIDERHIKQEYASSSDGDESTESDIPIDEECNNSNSMQIDYDQNKIGLYEPCTNLKCPISEYEECDELFSFYDDFTNHMEIFHGITKPYQCNQCDKKYAGKGNLTDHIKRVHKKMKKYECDFCQKGFFDKTNWQSHRRIHTGERPYKCEECGKAFTQSGTLSQHMQQCHSEERPFECTQCDSAFKKNKQLTQHIRSVHDKEKRFECKWCHKGFFNKSRWKEHHRVHTGEKPFKCDVCNKSFKQKSHLKTHQALHNSSKQFECNKCHKRFQTNRKRKSHQKKCYKSQKQ